MEILETQERKMNKNKEKKRELTHFLGHYPNLPNIHCATIYKLSQWKKNKMQRKFTFLAYGVIRIIYNLNISPIPYSYVV